MGQAEQAEDKEFFAVDLTQQERMQLISILPQQGDIGTVRKIRMLRDSLNIKAEERPRTPAPGVPMPRPSEIPAKSFSFTRSTKGLIIEQFKTLDTQKKLPVDYLDLYDKFVPEDKG